MDKKNLWRNRVVNVAGISNFTIEKVVNEIDDDLKAKFCWCFSFKSQFRFLSFAKVVQEKNAPYPFMIMNSDRAGTKGTHWWSFLEISSKEQIFLFDSYGFIGLKEFIIDNDRTLIDKFFYGLEKINKNDKKINLTYVKFDLAAFEKINRSQLTTTAQDFFHTLNEFAKVRKRKVVDVFTVDDCLQDLESETCGIYQLYFYTNLFLPKEDSKIVNNSKLTMKTIATLLNELFVLDINENERRVEAFATELDIKRN